MSLLDLTKRAPHFVYGWWVKFGPIMIRPDANDRSHRKIINYYWRGRWIFTSARRYIIIRIRFRKHIWMWYEGKIRYARI